MAKIRKRGNGYQIDYFDPNGRRVRKSFKKRKEAEAELGKRVSLIAEGRYLDVKKECTTTFGELIKKYTENFKAQSSFSNAKETYLESFKKYFGEDTLIDNIKYIDLTAHRNHLQGKLTPNGTVRKPSSVNREMSCLHHLFSMALEWDLADSNPFSNKKSLMLKENNMRLRFLSEEEIPKLLENCKGHLRDIVETALHSGMRRGEILSLKWTQVRSGFIYLRKTKTNNPRQIPINDALEALFDRLRGNTGKVRYLKSKTESPYVFIYKGNRIKNVKTSFNKAVEDAGLDDFHFHDLRHHADSRIMPTSFDIFSHLIVISTYILFIPLVYSA